MAGFLIYIKPYEKKDYKKDLKNLYNHLFHCRHMFRVHFLFLLHNLEQVLIK